MIVYQWIANYVRVKTTQAWPRLVELKLYAKVQGLTGRFSKDSFYTGRDALLDNQSLLRNLKYHEALYERLAKQYELAKIAEAKDSSVVQIMDKAIAPDRKSKPQRALIVLIPMLVAGFSAIVWVYIREALASACNDPRHSEGYSQLSATLLGAESLQS